MITVYEYENLGMASHGWLEARHHFSFGGYYNPERLGFGTLKVVNDDRIQGGTGFATHPHKDMEIITYVRQGAITHKDNQGNEGRTGAGDVQVMSAGTGIFHSEFNKESENTTLYQIWITPNKTGVPPRWDAMKFPKEAVTDKLNVLVSEAGAEGLSIYQDAKIYGGNLNKETKLIHPIKHQAYILASRGKFSIDGKILKMGDAAEVIKQATIEIHAIDDAEILIIDAPVS